MKSDKRKVKLQKRIEAWEAIRVDRLVAPNIKESNRSPMGTNTFRKPGSQKK